MLAFWLQLRRQRCQARLTRRVAAEPVLRCEARLGHDVHGKTAFERQHRASDGFTVRFWP